ncbi:protein adenylyltransferase SelO family protein [Elioraea thermophila]|uniref:protein adenylyltransferase SelO family protein n=1 Tax=Elioraea thermophila TaxID=2185104 RepID=UPI000DF3175C|nr:YdiU family protein [Elioraea thermophila]
MDASAAPPLTQPRKADPGISFDNTYARLPARFYARLPPTPVAEPTLIALNEGLCRSLGIDPEAVDETTWAAILAGNRLPAGAEPLAQAYAGHQFGVFVPSLGDGRAILLGEVVGTDGVRRDLQLKGSGRTPFSRMGDGRAPLGPVLREFLVSEAMAALGIPTTRSLAAVASGEAVYRDRVLPGGVLTRVASSHLRVGTFQYFAARNDIEAVRLLADYAIARHDPDLADMPAPERYRAFLERVALRQADLVAAWLMVGFVHGVMNTDNCAISGETIDFGPCAFLDAYEPGAVFSSIDHGGRYAYANQPRIAAWNLARLADCLLPLLAEPQEEAIAIAEDALAAFGERFRTAYRAGIVRKIGIARPREGDAELAADLLARMAENGADFTLTFRRLAEAVGDPAADGAIRPLFADPAAFDSWAERWRARLVEEGPAEEVAARMKRTNPAVIPRNHLVEGAIAAAVERGDLGPFACLHAALIDPYADRTPDDRYTLPPAPHERVTVTFCGT